MQPTELHLHDTPKPYTLSRLMASPVTGLLVSGIFNPFGPTVNAIVAVGELKAGVRLPVVRLMLNPFMQEVEEIGTLVFGKTWRPSAIIPQLFGHRAGSCPSLVLPLEQLKLESAESLFARFLRSFDDARGVYDRVREYFGKPWDRVSYEMSLGRERATNPAPSGDEYEPLDESEAMELAKLLLDEEHGSQEVQALFKAWDGSIHYVGVPGMASLPFQQFAAVLEHICSACRVPVAPPPQGGQSQEEMMSTVQRLQSEGRMPSLDQLLSALQDAVEESEEPPKPKKRKKKSDE